MCTCGQCQVAAWASTRSEARGLGGYVTAAHTMYLPTYLPTSPRARCALGGGEYHNLSNLSLNHVHTELFFLASHLPT